MCLTGKACVCSICDLVLYTHLIPCQSLMSGEFRPRRENELQNQVIKFPWKGTTSEVSYLIFHTQNKNQNKCTLLIDATYFSNIH